MEKDDNRNSSAGERGAVAGPSLAACPIDFHSHGVGRVDFMRLANLGLDSVETSLACEGVRAILTLYLPQHEFESFLELMAAFADRRTERYRHIVGIGLEGPVLASHGGTPAKGVWKPSKKQWRQIAACGAQGLQYVIVSPDAHFVGSGSDDDEPESLDWVIHSLLDGGVRPAPGHFSKADPARGAAGLERMLAIVRDHRTRPIVTDHLFNDMPLNFTHAWRTERRRQHRAEELAAIDLPGWDRSNLRSRLGTVPAIMIDAALDGLVKLCMNFDGDHVDLEISKRTVELVGAENFLLMTDRIQGQVLGGQRLTKSNENSLLYQQEGIVAGGSQFVVQQLYNMRQVGIPEHAIQQIGLTNPARVLGVEPVPGLEPEVAA